MLQVANLSYENFGDDRVMRLIDEDNAAWYLVESGRVQDDELIEVQRLAGGVSNEVLYVSFPDQPEKDFVLKQAREQLRVPDPWFCGVERIWREVAVLRVCEGLLAQRDDLLARTPGIVFEDHENYCFAMTAALREHQVWKQQLLAGQVDAEIARQCGKLLGALHAGTWRDPAVAAELDDRQIFDELRLDPYYRTVARNRPQSQEWMQQLVDSVLEHRRCLVHADFSPKNLLVYPQGLMMVDFETGHWGDPAFDLGFFLSHLILKAFERSPAHEPYLNLTVNFWNAYRGELSSVAGDQEYAALVQRGIANFAGCAWARLDGKSKIDYLKDEQKRDAVREVCRAVFTHKLSTWDEVLTLCRKHLT